MPLRGATNDENCPRRAFSKELAKDLCTEHNSAARLVGPQILRCAALKMESLEQTANSLSYATVRRRGIGTPSKTGDEILRKATPSSG